MTSWSSWSSFHADLKAEMILPYASRGVLYAAKLMVGCSGRPLHSAAVFAPCPPQAESPRIGARKSAAIRTGLKRWNIEAPFDRTEDVRRPPVAVGRSPVVRSTER